MIRFEIALNDWQQILQNHSPWFNRADRETRNLLATGRFGNAPSIWSDIKPVLIELQHSKCAYCERKFGEWPIEWDVEHFRPKNAVAAWPPEAIARENGLNYDFDLGGEYPGGYYALAYQFFNYLLSCKTCNSTFKKTFFPIGGVRGAANGQPLNDIHAYQQEMPHLIYPLGDIDTNPETLITFGGIIAKPTEQDPLSYSYRRAQVTIDLFGLNRREELWQGRAAKIVYLYMALANNNLPVAQQVIEKEQSPGSPHCNCGRAFVALYQQDRDQAQAINETALKLYAEYSR